MRSGMGRSSRQLDPRRSGNRIAAEIASSNRLARGCWWAACVRRSDDRTPAIERHAHREDGREHAGGLRRLRFHLGHPARRRRQDHGADLLREPHRQGGPELRGDFLKLDAGFEDITEGEEVTKKESRAAWRASRQTERSEVTLHPALLGGGRLPIGTNRLRISRASTASMCR